MVSLVSEETSFCCLFYIFSPVSLEKVPGMHSKQATEPADAEYFPSGQSVHSLAPVLSL